MCDGIKSGQSEEAATGRALRPLSGSGRPHREPNKCGRLGEEPTLCDGPESSVY